MIAVEQLETLDLLDDLAVERSAGPAVRQLRAAARSLVGDCRAIGVPPCAVLTGLRAVTHRAVEYDGNLSSTVGGEAVVRAWERRARDRLGRARLALEDDAERGRVHNCGHAWRAAA